MSDPIEKLNRLGDALEGAPMPLPASEIRARGDRIRRRKHALVAGASAAVVAAVAVPVVALTVGNGSDDPDRLAPQPSISDPVPAAPLSAENLLTGDDAVYGNGGADWRERDTFAGDGQATASPCQRASFASLGADPVFHRQFEFVVTDTGAIERDLDLNEVVAEFPSEAEAQAAYDEIRTWLGDCLPSPAEYYDAGEFSPVPIGVDGTAEVQLSIFGPVAEEIDPFGDEGWFLETGLVVSGDRIAVLTQLIRGQDYNWPDGTPVQQMLPVAAERLVLGNAGAPEETPSGSETDWPTTIPADFPLTSGWPEDDGSDEHQLEEPSRDNQAMIPAGELQACVFSALDPGALDRLTTRLSYGSASYVRELELFPTDQEAVTYLAHLRALYQGCPTDDQNGTPPTFTTEVNPGSIGEESVVITRASDGIGRVVINVVRVGNAVVVDLASDEGTGDTVVDLATVTRENLADVIGQLYELASPSGPGTDLTEPAGTTTVPADFPLDLVLNGAPPSGDSDTTVEGPSADAQGVGPQTICGVGGALPDYASRPKGTDDLNYSVSTIEGYQGRTLRAFPTVQEAVDTMELLRTQVTACGRDSTETSLTDRLWRTFGSDTGYDSVTFGYTYEVRSGVGAPAGQLYTAVRVGNAILALEWGGEYSAEYQASAAPEQVELAKLIGAEMVCVFAADGC